ncbi:hypothetical protein [Spiroplasma endosymbiont of Crioceris asparagi]|uniref:hypothetical protein n=1 Tax=Spiroplasma endosymbiont of Crioceris asparagi TaxID=3066286 RepID=UPI0030CCF812
MNKQLSLKTTLAITFGVQLFFGTIFVIAILFSYFIYKDINHGITWWNWFIEPPFIFFIYWGLVLIIMAINNLVWFYFLVNNKQFLKNNLGFKIIFWCTLFGVILFITQIGVAVLLIKQSKFFTKNNYQI